MKSAVMFSGKLEYICYCVFAFTSNAALNISDFEGEVIERNNSSIIKFTCKTYKRPIGDSIVFLLNEETTDVMRVLGDKCYHKYGECKNCHCFLSNNTMTFKWVYNMTVPCHNCTFGADMSFAYENYGMIRNVNLYRKYNCKDLGPLETNSQDFPVEKKDFPVEKIEEKGVNDSYSIPILICSIASGICVITTFLVLITKGRKLSRLHKKRTNVKAHTEQLLKNTDETELKCRLAMSQQARISLKLSREIMLAPASVQSCGFVSISKSKLVVVDNDNNTLKIYSDDTLDFEHNLPSKVNAVTCLCENVFAVTLATSITLFKLENKTCEMLKTIPVGNSIFVITSDKHHLLFKHIDEKTNTAWLKLYDYTSQNLKTLRSVPYSTGVSDKMALNMISKTVYCCDTHTDQVFALNFEDNTEWCMPIPKPTEIVIVHRDATNEMILVYCENRNEIYCVNKDEMHRVEEDGETIKKSSMFKQMTYKADLNQLLVQTAKNVINVYDITFI